MTASDPQKPSGGDLVNQLKHLSSLPNSNEVLAEKISRDWLWLQQLVTPSEPKFLRQNITVVRSAMQDAIAAAQEFSIRADAAVTYVTTPSETTQGSDPC